MTIGEKLRSARERRGWTVHQASNRTGVSAAHISRMENDKRLPTPRTIRQLADGYGEDYEELMRLAGHLDRDETVNESTEAKSVSEEFAALVKRLPESRQAWYRDILLLELRHGNFDLAMNGSSPRELVAAAV